MRVTQPFPFEGLLFSRGPRAPGRPRPRSHTPSTGRSYPDTMSSSTLPPPCYAFRVKVTFNTLRRPTGIFASRQGMAACLRVPTGFDPRRTLDEESGTVGPSGPTKTIQLPTTARHVSQPSSMEEDTAHLHVPACMRRVPTGLPKRPQQPPPGASAIDWLTTSIARGERKEPVAQRPDPPCRAGSSSRPSQARIVPCRVASTCLSPHSDHRARPRALSRVFCSPACVLPAGPSSSTCCRAHRRSRAWASRWLSRGSLQASSTTLARDVSSPAPPPSCPSPRRGHTARPVTLPCPRRRGRSRAGGSASAKRSPRPQRAGLPPR